MGLDQLIAPLSRGASPLVALAVAVLLGLRHAADPDHLVAVSTLVASEPDRPARRASALGLSWGFGHATTLIVLGTPIVLFGTYLPTPAQRGAEALVGIVIMALAGRVLRRWRRGRFHAHVHTHGPVVHRHLHRHESGHHDHEHVVARSRAQAYGIGLVHGVGGSAAVGVLLLASIRDQAEAIAALILFALATAVSMTALSLGVGYALARAPVRRRLHGLAPVLGSVSLAFGAWYALGALQGVG